MKMDEGMDTGPVFARGELPIDPADTSASLHEKLAALGGSCCASTCRRTCGASGRRCRSRAEGVVMAPMIKKEDGRLDFTRPAAELERRLRAFTPWPGAFTQFDGALLKVQAAKVGAGTGAPGEILRASAEGIEVATAQGSLVLTSLQPEGKKPMTAQQFLSGRKVVAGDRPFR